MKKTYMQPATAIALVKMESFLTTMSANGSTNNADDLLSRDRRGSSTWDDEE